MAIRREIHRRGSALYCHRNLAHAQVMPNAVMQQVVGNLPPAQRTALMLWLTRHGPYWEDARAHTSDDYLEIDGGDVVTDTAVGETAVCRALGLERDLVSVAPSEWLFTPVNVRWVHADEREQTIAVPNHWELASVQATLEAHPRAVASWQEVEERTRLACPGLTFAADAFRPLEGHPFAPSAADRIGVLLETLNQFRGCFDESGARNAEGQRLYQDFFTGKKAWFSDSSATEKNEFSSALSFPHPDQAGRRLPCTWHGKVNTPPIRIHFSWPVRADGALYVVYIGPKITKR